MATRWGGNGRSTKRAPNYQGAPGRSPTNRRGRTPSGQRTAKVEQAGNNPVGVFKRIPLPERPRFAGRYKFALAAFFFGSFFIATGVLTAYTDELQEWAYLGAFIISLVSSATVVLPAPGAAAIMLMAQDFDPLILGVVSGIGTGLGGITAYVLGVASRDALGQNRLTLLMHRLFASRLGPVLLFSANVIPFMPGDAVSVLAGAIRYPLLRYLLYMTTASVLKMIGLSFVGAFATGWLLQRLEIL
jgi:membrane protein YqaA with SNARE-associated domain